MNNQGKRPDQIKFSEDVTFYSMLAILFIILLNLFFKYI